MSIWKELTYTEPAMTTVPAATAKPVTEDEFKAMVNRLDATGGDFLPEPGTGGLSRRETETRTLQSRNRELEEIVRKIAPILSSAAHAMGLAARNEKPDARPQW